MNNVTQTISEHSILGLPRRPRRESLNSFIWGLWTENTKTSNGAISDFPISLKNAVTDYFAEKGLEVTGFYRSAISVEVIFRFGDAQYWSVKSILPDSLKLDQEDIDDWLYGNLIKKELPKKLRKIKKLLKI